MRKTMLAALATALIGAVAADSAVAVQAEPSPGPQRACLQNNRIWSWHLVDERTLIVSDRNYRPFQVRLTGGCVGLTNATLALRFRTSTSLGCLGQGDRVSFRAPALGTMSCMVTDVRPLRVRPGPDFNNREYDPRDGEYYDRRDDRYDDRDNDRRGDYDRL